MATMTLEQLVSQLQLAFGEGLRAVVLYGSGAQENAPPARALNVLVVVEQLTLDLLERESAIAAAWAESGHEPLLTMTSAEWRGSADVFPIEYADLLAAHKVLFGKLPLDGVTIARGDLRLHLEHETMGKLLRLRRGILGAGTESKRRIALMAESAPSFLVLFRALLRVHGEQVPVDAQAVVSAAAARAGFDAEPFRRALRHARGGEKIPAAEAAALLSAYLAGATRFAQHIDKLGVQ